MVKPQVENGYIRIANELWDEILRRNFSKRQQNLVLFIWRLSYGTGQKDCEVKQFNIFELSGMYKADVKKELNYLQECQVLNWEEKTMIFSINKNYKEWQISPNKNWDIDKFKELIHHNISRKKVGKTLTVKKKVVSKTLTYKSDLVSKTLTMELVKHLPRHGLILSRSRVTRVLKTLLKTLSTKDIKRKEEEEHVDPVIKLLTENHIVNPLALTQTLRDDLNDIADNFGFDNPDEMIVEAIKDSVRGNGRTWKFIYNKLNLWKKQGIKNSQDLHRVVKDNTIPFKPKEKVADDDGYNYGF